MPRRRRSEGETESGQGRASRIKLEGVIALREGAKALLESAASTLRALDAKGLLAYVLTRVALAESDHAEANRLFDDILPDLGEHLGLSARARDEACALARVLGRTIPMVAPTATSTPGI